MSKKSVPFRHTPIAKLPMRADDSQIESFVAAGEAASEALDSKPSEPEPSPADEAKRSKVRLTIDVDEKLHRRLRLYAAGDGRRLADIVRELLDQNLPKV